MFEAVDKTLSHSIHDHVINQSSVHKCRAKLRMKIIEKVKTQFYGNLQSFAMVHWNGKIFPDRDHRIERLQIVVISTN